MDKSTVKQQLREKYDHLAAKFQELYAAGKVHGREAVDSAMESAAEHLKVIGALGTAEAQELKGFLKHDFETTVAEMQRLGETAKKKLGASRIGAGARESVVAVAHSAGEALQSLVGKTGTRTRYQTGELTSAGSLTCTNCGVKVDLATTDHVPPCPTCGGTVFEKSH
jgi:rubrerythrin